MTYEEAINAIDIAISEVYPMNYVIVFEKAKEALEKQIPKKPIRLSGLCYCPFHTDVEHLFLNIEGEYWTVSEGQPYCEFCGQKLDWSEEE